MRIEERVGLPCLDQLSARPRLGIDGVGLTLAGGNVGAKRAMVPGVQHIVGRDLREVYRKLGAIGLVIGWITTLTLLSIARFAGSVTSCSASLWMWLVLDTSLAC